MKLNISPIIIDNTNMMAWEMKPYVAMVSKLLRFLINSTLIVKIKKKSLILKLQKLQMLEIITFLLVLRIYTCVFFHISCYIFSFFKLLK